MSSLRLLLILVLVALSQAHDDHDHDHHRGAETSESATKDTKEELNEYDRQHLDAGILPLTDETFNATIASHAAVLVKFYAPWCIHSTALAPEFIKAGNILKAKNSTVRLARVDASLEKKTAARFGVTGYPTLKYIKGDAVIDFNGGKTGEAIASWVETKLLPATTSLASVEEAEKFVASQSATVLGLFKGEGFAALAKTLEDAAFSRLDELPCGVTDSEEVLAHFGVTGDAIILFKNIDKERLQFDGPFDIDSIATFVKHNKLPLVVEFSHATAPDIFGGNITKHALLFVSKMQEASFQANVGLLREPARAFKNRVIFISVDTDKEENEKILQFFGVKKEELPALRLIALDMNMSKFRPTFDTLTTEAITEFVQGVLDGKIDPHLPSQDLPDDWDKHPVKVLVAKNFDEVTMDKAKTVFVMFYAPWCEHSKQLAPVWEQLAQEYAGNDTIVIAKMDSSANELSDMKIMSFPTLKIFPANSNDVFDFYGMDRSLASLKAFVDAGGRKKTPANEEPPTEEQKKTDEETKTEETKPADEGTVETAEEAVDSAEQPKHQEL